MVRVQSLPGAVESDTASLIDEVLATEIAGQETALAGARISARPRAIIHFNTGWRGFQRGDITQGGRLIIDYAADRLPACRRYHGGMPSWDIRAYVRFLPGGQLYNGNLLQHVEGTPPNAYILDPPTPIPFEVTVPTDATQVEMWFHNTDLFGCSVWDSRFGLNYRYDVLRGGPTIPRQSVSYRNGAIPSLEMVNVVSEAVSRTTVDPRSRNSAVQTMFYVEAWVNNVSYSKNVWVDVHVFDDEDALIHTDTLGLDYLDAAGGNGDFFVFDDTVYEKSRLDSLRAEARKVQYRLYYEVNNQIFTDSILHQLELD